MRLKLFTLVVGVLSLTALPVFGNTIQFTDGTFNLANYTETPTFLSNGSVTLSFDQCASCGNPGQALQLFSSIPNGGGTAAVGFLGNSFTYNPLAQGAIISIDASVDKDLTTSPPLVGGTNTFRPTIEQDGNFYLAAISGPTIPVSGTTGYNTLSKTGLLATDFLQYDFSTGTFGTANPNFNGDSMSFGLTQLFGTVGNVGTLNFEADYDNLNLAVHAVPEPSSLLLLSAGLIGLGIIFRRRLQFS